MTKVKMLTSMSGGPYLLPGEVTDIPDDHARAWIAAGLAVAADEPEDRAEPEPDPPAAPDDAPPAPPAEHEAPEAPDDGALPEPVPLPPIEEALARPAPEKATTRPRKKVRK